MRIGLVALMVVAIRPAHGHHQLGEAALRALTMIDRLPTKAELVDAFAGQDATSSLIGIATDSGMDFGVRLRAIRVLPLFCPVSCGGTSIHMTLLDLLSGTGAGGQTILRQRAGLEALGAIRTGDPADLSAVLPFLQHPSRDLRVATARAVAAMCNTQAIAPLRARYQIEPVEQVRIAISAALRDLDACAP